MESGEEGEDEKAVEEEEVEGEEKEKEGRSRVPVGGAHLMKPYVDNEYPGGIEVPSSSSSSSSS